MNRLPLVLTLVAAIPACAPARSNTPDSDARAMAIADSVMEALGGRQAWDRLAGLSWTFESAVGDTLRPGRRHQWDKRTGWHRVEGKNRQGQSYVMIDKLGDTEGMAWMDGQPIAGDSLEKLKARAHSMWTNDTYWMLMPYKLRDPGVRLKYDGEAREDDRVYDRLALSFVGVGETPGDRYWVYVNRANHRVEKWEYVLEGDPPPPEVWTWEGWEVHEGLWFPTIHRQGETVIYTRAIEVTDGFPASTFALR
jgi:hypothetical protein